MSEAGYVELPVIQWLSGQGSATPNDKGLGWTYRNEEEMAAFDRPLDDPLVEKLLVSAILRINEQVKTEAQALEAVNRSPWTMQRFVSSFTNSQRSLSVVAILDTSKSAKRVFTRTHKRDCSRPQDSK